MDGKTVPDATPPSRLTKDYPEALNIQYSNQDMQAPKYPFGKPCRFSDTPRIGMVIFLSRQAVPSKY
jgi:hypothetical protein